MPGGQIPEPGTRFRLAADVISAFRDKGQPIIYAKRGDIVTLIRWRTEVSAVECKGQKFGAPSTNLIPIPQS